MGSKGADEAVSRVVSRAKAASEEIAPRSRSLAVISPPVTHEHETRSAGTCAWRMGRSEGPDDRLREGVVKRALCLHGLLAALAAALIGCSNEAPKKPDAAASASASGSSAAVPPEPPVACAEGTCTVTSITDKAK